MPINRRQSKRLKIDQSVRIPVHLFSVSPFIGKPAYADSLNISAGGMALRIKTPEMLKKIKRGARIKIHFRLPGMPLQECSGKITYQDSPTDNQCLVGVKFSRLPKKVSELIQRMAMDNVNCDKRIREESHPWCVPTCSFIHLCRKPLRPTDIGLPRIDNLEIAFQAA